MIGPKKIDIMVEEIEESQGKESSYKKISQIQNNQNKNFKRERFYFLPLFLFKNTSSYTMQPAYNETICFRQRDIRKLHETAKIIMFCV